MSLNWAQLKERVAELEQQLDWFKRQLFGHKSEKQLRDDESAQGLLFATDKKVPSDDTATDIKAHKRKSNKQHNGDEVNDTGLRFDASVPTKVIDIPAPELQGEDAANYELIGYKDTNRLAQQPGSYTIFIGWRLASWGVIMSILPKSLGSYSSKGVLDD